jgi:hypothetical protein
MNVAIKFCGGCDPGYDRVEYFRQIQAEAGDRIHWVRVDEDTYEAILLIAGCQTACPEEELPPTALLVSVTNDELPSAKVVALLLGKRDFHAD